VTKDDCDKKCAVKSLLAKKKVISKQKLKVIAINPTVLTPNYALILHAIGIPSSSHPILISLFLSPH
jgi:hypothetical protein